MDNRKSLFLVFIIDFQWVVILVVSWHRDWVEYSNGRINI